MYLACCVSLCRTVCVIFRDEYISILLREIRVSTGKEVLTFHVNDDTDISVKCFEGLVVRLKNLIKYHEVVQVTMSDNIFFVYPWAMRCSKSWSCEVAFALRLVGPQWSFTYFSRSGQNCVLKHIWTFGDVAVSPLIIILAEECNAGIV